VHIARHGKQSYPSIFPALRLRSFSFIQRDYDALVPFLRNHFLFPNPEYLFCAVCVGHRITATMLQCSMDVFWIDIAYSWCLSCLDLVCGFIASVIVRGKVSMVKSGMDARA